MGWGWGSFEESQSLCGRGQRPLYFWRVGEGSQQESAARLSDPQGGREAGGVQDVASSDGDSVPR